MKHVNRVLEAHRVDRTVCVARVEGYDFEDGPATETLQSLYARVFFAPLSRIKGLPNIAPHGRWKGPEIPSRRSYPPNGLQLALQLYHNTFIRMFCQQLSVSHAPSGRVK